MAKEIIDNGSFEGDSTAESVYQSFEKTKNNFTDLYDQVESYANGEGKTFETITDAMSVAPLPEDNTPFKVLNDSYIYLSTEVNGYKEIPNEFGDVSESNTTKSVTGADIYDEVKDKTSTIGFSNITNEDALTFFNSIKDIYIYDVNNPYNIENYTVSFIWMNRIETGNSIGRIGIQLRRNGLNATNYGVSMDIEVLDLLKTPFIELDVQVSNDTLEDDVRVFVHLDIDNFSTDTVFAGINANPPTLQNSSKLLNIINNFNELDNDESVVVLSETLIDRSEDQTENESTFKSVVKNIWIVDPDRVETDVYKVQSVWVNDSIGNIGFQLFKNDADNSNFTLTTDPLPNSKQEIPLQNSSQPLSDIKVVIETYDFETYTTESFFQGIGGVLFFQDEAFNRSNVLTVSKNGGAEYTSIKKAIDSSLDGDIITIYPATYEEDLNTVGRSITLRGLDKHTTIIKTETGDYFTPPLECSGGTKAYNLTFRAGFSDMDLDNLPSIYAYGVHMDFDGEGVTEFNNCIVESHVNSAFGVGTRQNQTLKIIGCELKQYSDGSSYDAGAMYYHNSPRDESGQKLIMRNNIIESEHTFAMRIDDARDNAGGVDIDTTVEFINNTFVSAVRGVEDNNFRAFNASIDGGISGKIQLTNTSNGNNNSNLNN